MKYVEMKRILMIIFCTVAAFSCVAQTDELNVLTDIVKSLQTGGKAAFDSAVAKLAKDRQWTPMDELGIVAAAECKASQRVPGFRLNSIMTNAENAQRYETTTGNHLNGADSRFNYSLFEKTLKAGMNVRYTLPERWGKQTFIIIPFSGREAKLQAAIGCNGKDFTQTSLGNGVLRFSGEAAKGYPVEISISNGSECNISYVIINYNSRR